MKFVIAIAILFAFDFKLISTDEKSPCPDVFNYMFDKSETLQGIMAIPFPDNFEGSINLNVQLSIGTNIKDSQGSIQLLTSSSEILKFIRENKPLIFQLNFPHWVNFWPKVTSIVVNENSICSGKPIQDPLVTEISTVNLKSTVKIGKIAPHLLPTKKNTTLASLPTTTEQNLVISEVTVSQDSTNSLPRYCGIVVSTVSLIINGKPSEQTANPWLAALFKTKGGLPQFTCGATIITNKHIITAGHCVSGVATKKLHVVMGRENIHNWVEGLTRSIEKAYVHPDYKPNAPDADLAVLAISEEIDFKRNSNIKPICIWNDANNLQDSIGTIGIVAGWGKDDTGSISATPNEVTMPIVRDEDCLRSNAAFYYIVSNRTFCAGFNNNSGPCSGDSGGGFYVQKNNVWYIRGIVSHSLSKNNTCDLSNYLVFADIARHTKWIQTLLST